MRFVEPLQRLTGLAETMSNIIDQDGANSVLTGRKAPHYRGEVRRLRPRDRGGDLAPVAALFILENDLIRSRF